MFSHDIIIYPTFILWSTSKTVWDNSNKIVFSEQKTIFTLRIIVTAFDSPGVQPGPGEASPRVPLAHVTQLVRPTSAQVVTWGEKLFHCCCQALVQVPNPLSQQAPNPDPKVRQSLKKPKNPILWTGADTIITWASISLALVSEWFEIQGFSFSKTWNSL